MVRRSKRLDRKLGRIPTGISTKFASPVRKNTWYFKYKNCKQAGRTIDAYALEFQANWKKVDQRGMIPPDSVLADFMSGLDSQI